jgi:hypothetical protein
MMGSEADTEHVSGYGSMGGTCAARRAQWQQA